MPSGREGKGLTFVVTGGSSGIGAAIARLAATRGYQVAINYRIDADAAQAVASSIRAADGVAEIFQADVRDEQAVDDMFAAIDRRLGRLGVLVNNAGISGGAGSFAGASPAVLRDVVATNLLGAFFCSQAAVRRMSLSAGSAGGAIINVSSQAGQYGGNLITAYAASKAGVNTFTLGLAREIANEGIRVNAVSPGFHRYRHAWRYDAAKTRGRARRHSHAPSRPARGGRQGCTLAGVGGSELCYRSHLGRIWWTLNHGDCKLAPGSHACSTPSEGPCAPILLI